MKLCLSTLNVLENVSLSMVGAWFFYISFKVVIKIALFFLKKTRITNEINVKIIAWVYIRMWYSFFCFFYLQKPLIYYLVQPLWIFVYDNIFCKIFFATFPFVTGGAVATMEFRDDLQECLAPLLRMVPSQTINICHQDFSHFSARNVLDIST